MGMNVQSFIWNNIPVSIIKPTEGKKMAMEMDNGSELINGLEPNCCEDYYTHPHEYKGMIEQLHGGILNMYIME